MAESKGVVTRLIVAVRDGSPRAKAELVELVHGELGRLARGYMKNERSNHTLQPTALVNEAYIRLFSKDSPTWDNRAQFLGHAAVAMRHILVDHARGHQATKRGGKVVTVSLDEALAVPEEAERRPAKHLEPKDDESTRLALHAAELLDLDTALTELAQLDARQAKVVELRYFGGLTDQEIGAFMGMSERTVGRELRTAVPWLRKRLEQGRQARPISRPAR